MHSYLINFPFIIGACGVCFGAFYSVFDKEILDIIDLNQPAITITDKSNAFTYLLTSAKEGSLNSKVDHWHTFALNQDNLAYSCRVTFKDDNKVTIYDDETCVIYKLEGFDKAGLKDLHLDGLSQTLMKSAEDFGASSYQLLKMDKALHEKMKDSGLFEIKIMHSTNRDEKDDDSFISLKKEYAFDLNDQNEVVSELLLVDLKEPLASPALTGSVDDLHCQKSGGTDKQSCELYAFDPQLTGDVLPTHEQLKKLVKVDTASSISSLAKDKKYVLRVKGASYKESDFASNKTIDLFQSKTETTKKLTLDFKGILFGDIRTPNNHLLFKKAPDRVSFLVKKGSDQTAKITDSTILANDEKNYKCDLTLSSGAPTTHKGITCTVYNLPNLKTKEHIYSFAPQVFDSATVWSDATNIANNKYFKVSLYLDETIKSVDFSNLTNIKVVKAPSNQPADNKYFVNFDVLNKKSKTDFEGKSVLVIAKPKSKELIDKDDAKLNKCVLDSSTLECDLYKDGVGLNIFDDLTKLDFSTSIKSSLDASNQLEMNFHYLVDLKQEKAITALKGKKLEYYYAVNDNKQHKITFDIVNILTGKTGEKSDLALLI